MILRFKKKFKSFISFLKDVRLNSSNKKFKNFKTSVARFISQEGYYIFENPIENDLLNKLSNEAYELINSSKQQENGQLTGRKVCHGPLTETMGKVADKFKHYAEDFIKRKVKLEISYYQISKPVSNIKHVPGGEFHVDDNKANLKLFIYLTDVDENNGPFAAIPRTGSGNLKGSTLRGLLWEIFHKRFFLYKFLVNYSTYEAKKFLFTGKRGTYFFVDTTCLHKDTPVIKGERAVAVISFNEAE